MQKAAAMLINIAAAFIFGNTKLLSAAFSKSDRSVARAAPRLLSLTFTGKRWAANPGS